VFTKRLKRGTGRACLEQVVTKAWQVLFSVDKNTTGKTSSLIRHNIRRGGPILKGALGGERLPTQKSDFGKSLGDHRRSPKNALVFQLGQDETKKKKKCKKPFGGGEHPNSSADTIFKGGARKKKTVRGKRKVWDITKHKNEGRQVLRTGGGWDSSFGFHGELA